MGRFTRLLKRTMCDVAETIPAEHFIDYATLKERVAAVCDSAAIARHVTAVYDELDRVGAIAVSVHTSIALALAAIASRQRKFRANSASQMKSARVDSMAKEVLDLEDFIQVNRDGFLKIMQLIEKQTQQIGCASESGGAYSVFAASLARHPMCKLDLDEFVAGIGACYETVRASAFDEAAGLCDAAGEVMNDPPAEFCRKTTKYWVRPEDLLRVKFAIAKHVPIHSQPDREACHSSASTSAMPSDTLVSSVYFDDGKAELYHSRRNCEEASKLLRVRWYQHSHPPADATVYVEQKEHHESWVAESSSKRRFPIRFGQVQSFVNGHAEASSGAALAVQVQEMIVEKKLRPVVRTVYRRTAFQRSQGAAIRISLDNDLYLCAEHTTKQPTDSAAQGGWCEHRDCSFADSNTSTVRRFPFAVMEVKLRHSNDDGNDIQPPDWVVELAAEAKLIKAVPKFSKFLTACALFSDETVISRRKWPYWLNEESLLGSLAVGARNQPESIISGASVANAKGRSMRAPAEKGEVNERGEIDVDAICVQERRTVGTAGPVRQARSTAAKRTDDFRPCCLSTGLPVMTVTRVKVEPKTFFANERTFIQWLTAGMLLGTLSLAFFDMQHDTTGILFTIIAAFVMVYALVAFQWRSCRIRERTNGPYDDRYGPVVIVAALLGGLFTALYYKAQRPELVVDACGCHPEQQKPDFVHTPLDSWSGWSIRAAQCVAGASSSTQELAFCAAHNGRGPTLQDRFEHSVHDPVGGCRLIADGRTLPPFFTPSGLAFVAGQPDILLAVSRYQLVMILLSRNSATDVSAGSLTGTTRANWTRPSWTDTSRPVVEEVDACGCRFGEGWSSSESVCDTSATTTEFESLACLSGQRVGNSRIVQLIYQPGGELGGWSLPDLDIEAISAGPNEDTLLLGVERPDNGVVLLNLTSATWRFLKLTQWAGKSPVVEGTSYDRASDLTYVTTGSEITGFRINHAQRTVSAVVSLSSKSYGREIPSLQHKVGDIYIDELGLIYILLDDARRLRIFDLETGRMLTDKPLPMGFDGVELRSWEGITVVRDQQLLGDNNVWLYLAQDHPAEIWRYNFSLIAGFPPCGVIVAP